MMSDAQLELMEVGVVIGTHGLRGDLKIRTLPTGGLALPGARKVYLKNSEGHPVPYDAVRSSLHKQNILLRLSGFESLDDVQALIGSSVWMDKVELPELDDDQFFWTDIEGLEVVDCGTGIIGEVVGMFSTPAHDIIEVQGRFGEVLVPAVEPFLVEIDQSKGVLHVDLPEGLIPNTE